MGDIFMSWRLVDKFSAKELAALLSNALPELAADEALVPAMRRIESDYKRAIHEHREILDPSDLPNSELVEAVDEKALQSNAMIVRSKPDPYGEFDPHSFWEWLEGDITQVDGVSPDWQSPDLCYQWFSRKEIVRWLKANSIPSDFFLGSAQAIDADAPMRENERDRLLRQIGALSLLLAEKSNRYKRGDKPNATQISVDVAGMLDAYRDKDANKSALTGTPLRDNIRKGIERITKA